MIAGAVGGSINAADDPRKDKPPVAPAGLWSIDTGLAQPESAYYEPAGQIIYISNVQGAPPEKDGRGYISRVSPDGKVLDAAWITGLNAPKGMRSIGGKLYVTDIDCLVTIDIKTAKIIDRLPIAGAKFLNDVAIDSAGAVYVSDMFTSHVHRVRDGKAEVFLGPNECSHPNGLLVHDDELIVASWGEGMDPATFAVKKLGRLSAYKLADKTRSELTKEPLGNLDGVENDGSGGYYVSDWVAGKVWHVEPDGTSRLLLQGFTGSADIGLIEGKSLLLVPRMGEDRVTAYDLSDR